MQEVIGSTRIAIESILSEVVALYAVHEVSATRFYDIAYSVSLVTAPVFDLNLPPYSPLPLISAEITTFCPISEILLHAKCHRGIWCSFFNCGATIFIPIDG